jgi:hypothetical protein
MKAKSTIRKELAAVKLRLGDPRVTGRANAMAYGAMQALSWALDQDAARPLHAINHEHNNARHAHCTCGRGDSNPIHHQDCDIAQEPPTPTSER